MLPVKNGRVTQEYGRPGKYKKGYHTGIDLVAGESDKYIYSVGPGVVVVAKYAPGKGADPDGWGNYVIVRHQDGHEIIYAHLASVLVQAGMILGPGHGIGLQGSTGRSTGPHLHFEVRKGNWQNREDINPADYLGIENKVGPIALKDPFEADRQWAIENGISDGSDPDRPATRKEIWAMLRRMAQKGVVG
jgi:murein DD-endopeptidase MepM/ murein hydrolase activator NlpD